MWSRVYTWVRSVGMHTGVIVCTCENEQGGACVFVCALSEDMSAYICVCTYTYAYCTRVHM
jgi:hypothetical protein